MSRLRLLIVDDSNVIRRAVEKYLADGAAAGGPEFEIVGSAGDGEAALRLFSQAKPDFVTLDITMPRMDGLACLEKMLALKPDAKILVISALKDPATGLKVLKKGAAGFLLKPFTAAQLRQEVDAIFPDSASSSVPSVSPSEKLARGA